MGESVEVSSMVEDDFSLKKSGQFRVFCFHSEARFFDWKVTMNQSIWLSVLLSTVC
jgi:hypothetical protein